MFRRLIPCLAGAALAASLLSVPAALAHDSVIVGDYEIEFGWLSEPPVVGQANAIVLNISQAAAEISGVIRLASPADGAQIQGDRVQIEVTFEGVEASSVGIHWHMYVDDQLTRMFPLEQNSVTLSGLRNGTHRLRASLSDEAHGDVGEAAQATITVTASTGTGHIAVTADEAAGGAADTAAQPHDAAINVDVSGLRVEVIYGPARKTLSLQPLGEDTPGQFIARLTPMRAGEYTVRLTGKIGEADVNVDVTPEAVEAASVLQFPEADTSGAAGAWGASDWMALAGLIFGLAGTGLGLAAWLRRK